jgi:mannose-1-phosphate guanylyltransferase
VEQFIEKPAQEVAEAYVRAGNYGWNAGIFFWRVDRILDEIRRFVPEVADVLDEIGVAAKRSGGRMTLEVEQVMHRAWPRLQKNVTIDVGVAEKATGLVVIPVDVGWSDVGSWSQVAALRGGDATGNAVVGLMPDGHLEIDTRDTLVYSTTGRTIATLGISGLVIVDTGDALLVCTKEESQRVKDIVELWQRQNTTGR